MSDQPSINTTSGGVTLNASTINIMGDVTGRDKLASDLMPKFCNEFFDRGDIM